ncbi:hypothetical protein [Tranquillimonas rosea]|uniref:hypothetical protein n=1 Tax=Tranquillimonas rosea TaxID=641238 RepID=UPI003BACBC24
MSNPDSFIDEVSEEVRRDRMFHFLRRWGWVGIVAVVVLVAGAAWNEYRKAQQTSEAQAFGSSILSALEQDSAEARRAALAEIDASGARQAILTMIAAGEVEDAEMRAASAEALDALAGNQDIDAVYRDLAQIKSVLLLGDDLDPQERIDRLEPLIIPGAPYRLLALEQTAMAHVAAGDDDAALGVLQDLIGEDGVSQGLQQRASQLIVALGGSPDAA